MGSPPLGVPPGELAHEDAIRIFGVINVLSDRRRFGNAFETRKKLLSGDDGEPKNHPPRTPEPKRQLKWEMRKMVGKMRIGWRPAR